MPVGYDAQHWANYWRWLMKNLRGNLVIGDFNVDPNRRNSQDSTALKALEQSNWQLGEPVGEWSFKSSKGHCSKIDHVLFYNNV